jgi:hypothetical protein
LQNPVPVHGPHWAAQFLAIRSRIPNPGTHPFPNQVMLKLRDSRHDCEECLPQSAGRVYVLLIGNELDAERPKFFQRREKVLGGPGEPIKAPYHNRIELPLPGVVHQFIEFGARVFSAGLPHVYVFANQIKSSRRAVGPQIADLKLTALVLRADPSIDGDSHGVVLRGEERKTGNFRSPRFPPSTTTNRHI